MKFFILFTLLFTLELFSSTEFEKAYVIYKDNDFNKSLELFTDLVDKQNDYDAAYILGFMYEHGEGCEKDMQKSQKYYKISSHGYYWQIKADPSREIKKEQKKHYENLAKPEDKETQETIKQYMESSYSMQAHHENYFLPISHRFNGSYPVTGSHEVIDTETEFQLSIKYDYAANVFGLNEIYSVGYTQVSFWQLYAESAYFRETNYNPEAFVTLPFSSRDYFKAIRVGFEHQSNGRGGEEERSWNYVSTSFYFQTGFLFTEINLWKDVFSLRYNPDLMNYLGYGEIKFMIPYKSHILKLISRNTFSDKRATEVNYSYPVFGSKDLFFYLKGFSGYGESLIDYENKVDKFGIGFSISR